jgi:hypothetical protein
MAERVSIKEDAATSPGMLTPFLFRNYVLVVKSRQLENGVNGNKVIEKVVEPTPRNNTNSDASNGTAHLHTDLHTRLGFPPELYDKLVPLEAKFADKTAKSEDYYAWAKHVLLFAKQQLQSIKRQHDVYAQVEVPESLMSCPSHRFFK